MVLVVVPGKKLSTESSGILVTAKPLGKLWAVLHRLELALRVRIVIGDMRTAVGLGYSQLRQQEGHRLGVSFPPLVGQFLTSNKLVNRSPEIRALWLFLSDRGI